MTTIKKIVFLLCFLLTINGFAGAIKLLHCHIPSKKKQENVQCIYSVYGQSIKKPDTFSKLYVNTKMPYALCANILCDIDPDKPSYATCVCPVIGGNDETQAWQKVSVGPVFYEAVRPKKNKLKKLKTVPSTFSLANVPAADDLKPTTCKFNEPTAWANCFGKICKVHYEDKNGKSTAIATCRCKVVETVTFTSTGPKNESECKTQPGKIWSAATERQASNEFAVMRDSYRIFFPKSPHVDKEAAQDNQTFTDPEPESDSKQH